MKRDPFLRISPFEKAFPVIRSTHIEHRGTDMGKHDAIYAAGIWSVRPGNEQAFIEAWKEFSAWTALRQRGSGYGKLLQDLDNPSRFISFGPWDDLEGVQSWRQQPEFRKTIARFMELCDQVTPGIFREVAGDAPAEGGWTPGSF